jgi:hypothetical protein
MRRRLRGGGQRRFDRAFFVVPAFRRCLFTVRAAICFARRDPVPRFIADCLMCSYCRFRLGLFTPLGGMRASSLDRS